jgi:hypothetical protein
MALTVEQFTAPGKFEIDLAMEKAKMENERPAEIYLHLKNRPMTSLFNHNPYYTFYKTQDK